MLVPRESRGLSFEHCIPPSGPGVQAPPPNGLRHADFDRMALEEIVSSNADIVRSMSDAIARGDSLAVMGLVSRDVRWAVNASDRTAAPWFGIYEGKRALMDLFEAFTSVQFTDITRKALIAEGDLVVTVQHVGFTTSNGRHVEMDEVMVWTLHDGKVTSVDVLMDTAAVAAAFA